MPLVDYYKDKYSSAATAAAERAGVPPAILSAFVGQSSDWNPYSFSEGGNIGLGGLSAADSKSLGVNPWNPEQNLAGTAATLAEGYRKLGNWRDAIAAESNSATADAVLTEAGPQYSAPDANTATSPTGENATNGVAPGESSSLVGDWLASLVKRFGFLILALGLVALGLWVMISKGGAGPALRGSNT